METEKLKEILDKHGKWLRNQEGGERAILRDADLRRADLRRAVLSDAILSDADLSDADLSDAILRRADLRRAILSDAILSDADLRRADLSCAVLRRASLPKTIKVENLFTQIKAQLDEGGQLEMGGWHKGGYCGTIHCIAGWVNVLAGETGRVMEGLLGPSYAATLIILESCPYLEGKVPHFYSNNEDGMKFINECAEKEAELVEIA